MKARPRSVENQVAAALNQHFQTLAVAPVERIPVLGRSGPDLTTNELNLIVDVKSRLEIPRAIFIPLAVPFCFDDLTLVRLANLPTLWDAQYSPAAMDFSSKLIRSYLAHMDEWTRANAPDGISCVILHRPKMPIGDSVAAIYSTSRRRLIEYATRYRIDDPRE